MGLTGFWSQFCFSWFRSPFHKEPAAPLRPCGERVGALTLFLLNHSHSDPFSPFGFTRVP